MITINHIIFLYWNRQITQEQMLGYLKDIPPDITAEWIDDLVNRVPDAMLFATSGDRVDYPDGREMPREDIHERILQAARQFCIGGSIKNWQAGTAFRAKEAGLCEDWEYWTFGRIAHEMQQKVLAGKRKLY